MYKGIPKQWIFLWCCYCCICIRMHAVMYIDMYVYIHEDDDKWVKKGQKVMWRRVIKKQKRREWSPKGVMGWADLGAKIDGLNSSLFFSLSISPSLTYCYLIWHLIFSFDHLSLSLSLHTLTQITQVLSSTLPIKSTCLLLLYSFHIQGYITSFL